MKKKRPVSTRSRTIGIPLDLYAEIVKEAKFDERSVHATIIRAIRYGLDGIRERLGPRPDQQPCPVPASRGGAK